MASILPVWIALTLLGSGPDPGAAPASIEDAHRLACYRSSERSFIKEEKEKLAGKLADYANMPWKNHELEKARKILLERLVDYLKALLKRNQTIG